MSRSNYEAYQLRIKLGETWLAGIVEDQHCVDHDVGYKI